MIHLSEPWIFFLHFFSSSFSSLIKILSNMGVIRIWQRKLKTKLGGAFDDIYPGRHRRHHQKRFLRSDGVRALDPLLSLKKGHRYKQNSQKVERKKSRASHTFEGSPKIPSLSEYISIKQNEEFGRHIVAEVDLEVGQKVAVAKAFASVVNRRTKPYCLTCFEVENVFIPCDRCPSVMFCSLQCKTNNVTHEYECGTNLHGYDFTGYGIDIKCAIQMVLEALATFAGNVRKLYKFMESLIDETDGFRLLQYPAKVNDKQSHFRCTMNLQTSQSEDILTFVQNAYDIIMEMPKVRNLFSDDYGQTFLLHLLAHNFALLTRNGFHRWLGDTIGAMIFNTFSIFNHSCSPNVTHLVRGNMIVGITGRYIEAGEQMCISYRCVDELNRNQRNDQLHHWKFECQCDRCSTSDEITMDQIRYAERLSTHDLKKRLNKKDDWTTRRGALMIAYSRHLDRIFKTGHFI